MARLNTASKKKTRTVNRAGGMAYKLSANKELAELMLTSLLKDKYYESSDQQHSRLVELIQGSTPEFVAKLAVFARDSGMRTVSHIAAVHLLALMPKGKPEWLRRFYAKVINRPDDIAEILAYFAAVFDKSVLKTPSAMRRGLRDALEKFSNYQIAKYKLESKALKMRDIINILHPRPQEWNRASIEALMTGAELKAETWETMVSAAGGDEEETSAAWETLLREKKLGYMALVRNLRNILQTGKKELVRLACEQLPNKDAIVGSKIFPHRLYTAYEQIQQHGDTNSKLVLAALSQAIDLACSNLPVLENSLVVIDRSGSMSGQPIETAAFWGAALAKAGMCDLMTFSDDATYENYNPSSATVDIMRNIIRQARMGGTDFSAAISEMRQKYDRVIFFSDMQGWMSGGAPLKARRAYEAKHGTPFYYTVDLNGYGDSMFPENDSKVMMLSGWSYRVLGLMGRLEQDRLALLHEIEAVEI